MTVKHLQNTHEKIQLEWVTWYVTNTTLFYNRNASTSPHLIRQNEINTKDLQNQTPIQIPKNDQPKPNILKTVFIKFL